LDSWDVMESMESMSTFLEKPVTIQPTIHKNEESFRRQIQKWYNTANRSQDEWEGTDERITLCMVYLALRYRTCFPINDKSKYLFIDLFITLEPEEDNIPENEVIMKQIAECIKKTPDRPFAVYISVMFHANILIYNPHDYSLEHFEPYGDHNNDNFAAGEIGTLVGHMNDVYFKNKRQVKYVSSAETCPTGFGLQSIDDEVHCVAWSCMIAELRLQFPMYNVNDIQTMIKRVLSDSVPDYNPDVHNINLIKGYIAYIDEQLNLYVGLATGKKTELTINRMNTLELLLSFVSDKQYKKLIQTTDTYRRPYGEPVKFGPTVAKRMKLYKYRNIKTPSKIRSMPTLTRTTKKMVNTRKIRTK